MAAFWLLSAPWAACMDVPLVRSPWAAVDRVSEASPAERSGLKPDDLIVEVDGRIDPSLEELLAVQFEKESATETPLTARRGSEVLRVVFRPEPWGCRFRPDFSEDAKRRLAEAREALNATATWETGRDLWMALTGEVEINGFVEAARWLRLELGAALVGNHHWASALNILDPLAKNPSPAGFWAFRAMLHRLDAFKDGAKLDEASEAVRQALEAARASGSDLRLA